MFPRPSPKQGKVGKKSPLLFFHNHNPLPNLLSALLLFSPPSPFFLSTVPTTSFSRVSESCESYYCFCWRKKVSIDQSSFPRVFPILCCGHGIRIRLEGLPSSSPETMSPGLGPNAVNQNDEDESISKRRGEWDGVATTERLSVVRGGNHAKQPTTMGDKSLCSGYPLSGSSSAHLWFRKSL